MAKKKPQRQKQRLIEFCENDGGLGIDPCTGSEVATVDVILSKDFTMSDKPTLHLCDDCAQRLKDHADQMGYDVKIG